MWVKICGINNAKTAAAIAALGPNAVGLNFYAQSPRVVSRRAAAEIVAALPATVEPVGVFVNHTLDEILATCDECGIKTVQLHGDETPAQIAELQSRADWLKIIRVCRLGAVGIVPLMHDLEECCRLRIKLYACLVDARVDGVYGGTGQTIDWKAVAAGNRGADWPPLVLAGGLRPENVAAAIAAADPWGVDVAGGVETSPGVKDLSMVAALIQSARRAGDANTMNWADGI